MGKMTIDGVIVDIQELCCERYYTNMNYYRGNSVIYCPVALGISGVFLAEGT